MPRSGQVLRVVTERGNVFSGDDHVLHIARDQRIVEQQIKRAINNGQCLLYVLGVSKDEVQSPRE